MNANKLSERIAAEFARNGFALEYNGQFWHTGLDVKVGDCEFVIEETYRHNGTVENVTSKISVSEIIEVINEDMYRVKHLVEIKIPKNASDKVIANRVAKAIAAYNEK